MLEGRAPLWRPIDWLKIYQNLVVFFLSFPSIFLIFFLSRAHKIGFMLLHVSMKVEFLLSWFSLSEFACIQFFRLKSTLNNIFYCMFMCLEIFQTIKVLYWSVHITHESMICKQSFEWSKIMKWAFEFVKQIIVINIILFIILNVDL